jgi:hypothetical protein
MAQGPLATLRGDSEPRVPLQRTAGEVPEPPQVWVVSGRFFEGPLGRH